MKKWVLYLFIFIQCLHGLPTLTMETVNVPRAEPKTTAAGKGEAGYTAKPEREVPEASMSEIEKQTLEREKRIKEAQANEGAKTTKTNQQRTITEEQYQQELDSKQPLTAQTSYVITKGIQSAQIAYKDTIQLISDKIQNNKPIISMDLQNVSSNIGTLLDNYEALLTQNPKFTTFNSLEFINWAELGDQQNQFINILEQSNLLDSLIRSLSVLKLDLKLDPQEQSKLDIIKQWVQNQVEQKHIDVNSLPLNQQVALYRALRNVPNKNIYYALQFKDTFESLYQDNLDQVKLTKKGTVDRNKLLEQQETIRKALVENYEYLMSNAANKYIAMADFRQFAHRFAQLEGKSLKALWDAISHETGAAKVKLLNQFAKRWLSFTSFLGSCGSPFDILYAMRLGMPAARTLVRLNNAQGQDALSASDDMLDLAMNLNQWNRFNENQAYFFNKPSIVQSNIAAGDYAGYAIAKLERYNDIRKRVNYINSEITDNAQNYTTAKIQELTNEAAYQTYLMQDALRLADESYKRAVKTGSSARYAKQLQGFENKLADAQAILDSKDYLQYQDTIKNSLSDFEVRRSSELKKRMDAGSKNENAIQKLIEKQIKAEINPLKSRASDIFKLVFFLLPLMIAIIQLIANEEEDKGQIPAFTPKSGSSGMFL